VDDETIIQNAVSSNQSNSLKIPCLPNQQYYFKGEGNFYVASLNSSNGWLQDHFIDKSEQGFTTHPSASQIQINTRNPSAGTFTFKRPMLNLGSTPAPYSKKTGDKMVLPTAKKNLLVGFKSGLWSLTNSVANSDTQLQMNATGNSQGSYLLVSVKPNTNYYVSFARCDGKWAVYNADASINLTAYTNVPGSFNSGNNTSLRLYLGNSTLGIGAYIFDSFQLEEGATATPYSPYAVQVNKKPQRKTTAKTGINLNNSYVDCGTWIYPYLSGKSDMTIDLVFNPKTWSGAWAWLVACNKDSLASEGFYVGADLGSKRFYFYVNGQFAFMNSDLISANVDNHITCVFKNGNRLEIYLNNVLIGYKDLTTPITVNLPSARYSLGINKTFYYTSPLVDAVYKYVKIYTNDGLVVNYDFENPRNIVGNQVIPNAQNLIPSFEDSRWSIHANAKVMGKDVLHLDATASSQYSGITLDVVIGKQYMFVLPSQTTGIYFDIRDGVTDSWIFDTANGVMPRTYTFSTNKIKVNLRNNIMGSFDFIRPQLYQLTGFEGTINGAPQAQLKSRRRAQYAKR
jgi:hypothetical protein